MTPNKERFKAHFAENALENESAKSFLARVHADPTPLNDLFLETYEEARHAFNIYQGAIYTETLRLEMGRCGWMMHAERDRSYQVLAWILSELRRLKPKGSYDRFCECLHGKDVMSNGQWI